MPQHDDASPQRIPRRSEHPGAVARRRRRRLRFLLILLAILLAAPLFYVRDRPPASPEAPAVADGGEPVPPETADRSLLQTTRDRILELVRPVAQ